MGSGTFRLKGSSLLKWAEEKKGVKNKLQLSYEAKIAYNTIQKYLEDDELMGIDLRVFATFLIQGIGFTPDELMDLKFGDIFEYVEEIKNGAAD